MDQLLLFVLFFAGSSDSSSSEFTASSSPESKASASCPWAVKQLADETIWRDWELTEVFDGAWVEIVTEGYCQLFTSRKDFVA